MSAKQKAPDSPEKISVIDAVENGLSHCAVALKFDCGHTQVNQIMLHKETSRTAYQEGMNAVIKYLVPHNMQYPEIDEQVWDFCLSRSKCIPINGPMLQSEANECAIKLNYNNFSVSNGWLKSFCACHQIKFSSLRGESTEVSQDAVQQWMQDLPKITEGYELRDIYNCDETSIVFEALPKQTLLGPSKERFSLLLCANAIGEKEKLLIIGKSKRPHSFPKYNSEL